MVRSGLGVLVVALAALGTAVGCTGTGDSAQPSSAGGLPVVAAFYPLYEFSRSVGGDRVQASNLVAAGAEPHDFDPSPRDLERIRQARLMVYIPEFQPGLDKALETAKSPNLVVLDVLQGMDLLAAQEEEEHAAGKEKAGHEETGHDPHVWLDPVLAKAIVTRVRDALVQIDPSGKETYTANAQRFAGQLDQLDQEFRRGLASCARREFITSHTAFSYLARRYDLTQTAISGLSPEAEPSPARLREIVDAARSHKANVIFFETLVSPKVAEVVAREIGAKTMVLNPVEGLTNEEERQGKGYVDVMRQNLANLRVALECR